MEDCPNHQQNYGGVSCTAVSSNPFKETNKTGCGKTSSYPAQTKTKELTQFARTSDVEEEEILAIMGTKRTKGEQGLPERYRAKSVLLDA